VDGSIKKQLEYMEGSSSAEIIDMITLQPIEKCTVDVTKMAKLVKDFEAQKHDIENPKCFLAHWHGQVTFNSNGVTGKCSLRMNKDLSERFEKLTGVSPSYQCEKDYFLHGPESDGTAIYKKTKAGWELDCKAPMQRSGRDDTDWKNPPDYYVPDGELVLPKGK